MAKLYSLPWLFLIGATVFLTALASALLLNQSPKPAPTPSAYTCPPTEYVDCMPGPNMPVRPQCGPAYLTWATANCPGFKGAAL